MHLPLTNICFKIARSRSREVPFGRPPFRLQRVEISKQRSHPIERQLTVGKRKDVGPRSKIERVARDGEEIVGDDEIRCDRPR